MYYVMMYNVVELLRNSYITDKSNGVTLKTIGQSHEGRDIYRLDIGYTSLPTMVVDCGIHAREWASPAFCLYMINELINGDYTEWTGNNITSGQLPVGPEITGISRKNALGNLSNAES